MSPALVLYFQVHQPWRLLPFRFFDIGRGRPWFDDAANEALIRKVADRCYRPTTRVLRRALREHQGRFRVALSLSGTVLDQLERWAPDVLDGFRALVDTGAVELLGETSHHALAGLFDPVEFAVQVRGHAARLERLFGVRPTAFRNTELLLTEDVLRQVDALGFDVVLGEGADALLAGRSPHHVARVEGTRVKALLRDHQRSDAIGFRFADAARAGRPLTASTWADALDALPGDAEVVNVFLDLETFGEHQPADSGIFEFLLHVPREVLRRRRWSFETPSEAARRPERLSVRLDGPVSWADQHRDASAWLGNALQRAATDALYRLAPEVRRAEADGRAELVEAWRRLTTSDHVYYMFTRGGPDAEVHRHFSPYATPHDAHIAFMNVLDDLGRRLRRETVDLSRPQVRSGAALAGVG